LRAVQVEMVKESKGDSRRVWKTLGAPQRVRAHLDVRWPPAITTLPCESAGTARSRWRS
jgi:hypothetical protein